eukprot:COSAG01_NODE_1213_length_11210_cov_9.262353_11_plen_46_part_00
MSEYLLAFCLPVNLSSAFLCVEYWASCTRMCTTRMLVIFCLYYIH